MNKDDCWMTFSEALEMYLENREVAQQSKPGRNRDECLVHMDVAAKHMDALTQPAPDQSAEIERLRKELGVEHDTANRHANAHVDMRQERDTMKEQVRVLSEAANTLLLAEHRYAKAYERGAWSGKFNVELSEAERRGIAYEYREAKVAMAAALAAAKPAVCETCNGHGMIGGFINAANGYDAKPCPDCSTVKPAARKTCAVRGFMFGNDEACSLYCVGGGCGSDEPCEHQQPAGQEGEVS